LTFKSWAVTMRDERLKEFESRVLRKIFGLKRERVTMDWRRLRSEEIHDLYLSQNILGDKIKEKKMGRVCALFGGEERRGLYRILVGKHEAKRPLRRTSCIRRMILNWFFKK